MTQALSVPYAGVDVVTALGLSPSQRYVLEAVVGLPALGLFEGGAAMPTDRTCRHHLAPGARLVIQPAAGVAIWVWSTRSGVDTKVVVTAESS